MLCGVLLYLLFPGAAPYCLLFASFLLFIVALFCKGEKRKIVICFSLGFCLALFSVSFCRIKGALLEKYQGEIIEVLNIEIQMNEIRKINPSMFKYYDFLCKLEESRYHRF